MSGKKKVPGEKEKIVLEHIFNLVIKKENFLKFMTYDPRLIHKRQEEYT